MIELLNTYECCRDGGTWRDLLDHFDEVIPPPHDRITRPSAFFWRYEPEREAGERNVTRSAKRAVRNGLANEIREGRRKSWVLLGAIVSGADH